MLPDRTPAGVKILPKNSIHAAIPILLGPNHDRISIREDRQHGVTLRSCFESAAFNVICAQQVLAVNKAQVNPMPCGGAAFPRKHRSPALQQSDSRILLIAGAPRVHLKGILRRGQIRKKLSSPNSQPISIDRIVLRDKESTVRPQRDLRLDLVARERWQNAMYSGPPCSRMTPLGLPPSRSREATLWLAFSDLAINTYFRTESAGGV